jgi:TorA maturation chaperone TorD
MPNLLSADNRLTEALLEAIANMSGAFWGPEPDTCRAMRQGDWLRPLRRLSTAFACEPADAVKRLEALISSHADADALFEHLETDYVSLFVSNRGGICAPLYQSCYDDAERPGHPGMLMGPSAAAMQVRLKSAGLTLDSRLAHPPDHLAVELEYLYFVLNKWRQSGDAAYLGQASTFAGDVMLPWVRQLREKLSVQVQDLFYPLLSSLTVCLLEFVSDAS